PRRQPGPDAEGHSSIGAATSALRRASRSMNRRHRRPACSYSWHTRALHPKRGPPCPRSLWGSKLRPRNWAETPLAESGRLSAHGRPCKVGPMIRLAAMLLATAGLGGLAAAAAPANPYPGYKSTIYSDPAHWVCRPDKDDVCDHDLDATA